MFYFVYVLRNKFDKSLYIGFSAHLQQRIKDHLDGKGGVTRRKKGWEPIYFEGYRSKIDALNREKFLKGGSGRKYLNKQLKEYLSKPVAL